MFLRVSLSLTVEVGGMGVDVGTCLPARKLEEAEVWLTQSGGSPGMGLVPSLGLLPVWPSSLYPHSTHNLNRYTKVKSASALRNCADAECLMSCF